MYASKRTIIFFLGKKNYGILFLQFLVVIVCANLTSNIVTFKRIAYMSILTVFTMITEHTHVGNNYQAFSSHNSSFDIILLKSCISRSEKVNYSFDKM